MYLNRQCEEALDHITGQISRVQGEYDRKSNILRIGDMVIEDAKTFSLPKWIGNLKCPEGYSYESVHNTLLGQNGVKDWVERIDKSAAMLQGLSPTQEKDVIFYMQQLRDGVKTAMEHGYLATRIYGSIKRKSIVENFVDSIDLYIQRCEEKVAA